MEKQFDVRYGITRRLPGVTVEEARARITTALHAEGFGVLTEIDVRATLEKKLGVQTEPYVILGACNPQLAHRALQAAPAIGLLLPCNVVVTTDGGDAIICAASPKAMFSVADATESIAAVSEEAEDLLRRAVASA